MKKFRSNLPRRKRTRFSPLFMPKLAQNDVVDSFLNLAREVSFSSDSSSVLSTNNKPVKKRSFDDENGAESGEFRRITRSCNAKEAVEVSESSSCVDNDVVSGTVSSKREVKYETMSCFECSVIQKRLTNGRDNDNVNDNDVVSGSVSVSVYSRRDSTQVNLMTSAVNESQNGEDNDVVSVSVYSRRDSPQTKLTTSCFELLDSAVNDGQNGVDNDAVSVSVSSSPQANFKTTSCLNILSDAAAVNESQNGGDNDAVSVYSRRDSPQAKLETTSCFNESITNKTVNDGDETETENCGESKLNLADIDLTCSEQFSDSEYSSAGFTDTVMESSEIEFSSDFATLSWYDSGSQFSERSVGDPVPSPMFQLFLIYRQKFCKSEFSTLVASEQSYNEASDRVIKLLRPEDEEHEESYQMMKKRERRQVYLHDYAEEYCVMKEYGDLVVQQRLQMVHWIMEQAANKDLQKETMFLGVNLLDRFLSKGYFRSQMELEIAGIACLTLATRIEENQPYNSIQQTIFNVGSNEYRRSEVVAMEWLVQEVLNFQCYLPTIYNFLWFYLKAARSDEGVDKTAKYLAVLSLLGHEQLCFWPSTVAASLVSLACLAGKGQSSLQQIAWIHNGSNDKDLPDCIKSLEWLVQYIC